MTLSQVSAILQVIVSQAVLVLNQNYEPLNVCQTRRAVVRLIGGKAEIVVNSRGYVHTPTMKFPRPSVIRLANQVRRPRLRAPFFTATISLASTVALSRIT